MTLQLVRRRAGLLGALGACTLAVLAAPGCNILGPVATVVAGPPKIEAKYRLDPDRPTVIFIDDRANRVPQRALRFGMAREAETVMMEKKVVRPESMIASQGAMQFAATERSGSLYSVSDIGRSVGAEVVICITMESWTPSRDGVSFSPIATANVKVLDIKNNQRLWPAGDQSGHPLVASMPPSAGEAPKTSGELNAAHAALAHIMGREIARLFFTYERDSFQGSYGD